MAQKAAGFRFAIDRGGTFTDVYAQCPSGKTRVMKLLSEDPGNYPDAPREGIRRILQQVRTLRRNLENAKLDLLEVAFWVFRIASILSLSHI